MLRVTVEVLPGGVGPVKEIGTLLIANESGEVNTATYNWLWSKGNQSTGTGSIRHTRSDGALYLVKRIIEQMEGPA